MNTPNWSERLLETMMSADRVGAARVIDEALAEGMLPGNVITSILDPALFQIGQLWGERMVSLAQTIVGAKIAEDVLLRCLPGREAVLAIPRKGAAVIGNIEDDYHSLGRRMIASFLGAAGWDVHDLGNDVQAEQFVDKAIEVGAFVMGASAMMQTTALNIRKLRDLIDARKLQSRLKLAVGGAVFNWRPELVSEVGGDGTAQNAAGVDALFERLQTEAKGGADR